MYTKEDRKKTAYRLRALRGRERLSIPELSRKIKSKYDVSISPDSYGVSISPDSIRVWETDVEDKGGRFKKGFGMRIDSLCCLADFFDVSPGYLLGEDQYTEQTNLGLSDKAVETLETRLDPVGRTTDRTLTALCGSK